MASINKKSTQSNQPNYNGYISKTSFLNNVTTGDFVELIPSQYITNSTALNEWKRLYKKSNGLSFRVKKAEPCFSCKHGMCSFKIAIEEGSKAECFSWEAAPILEKVPSNK